MKTFKKIISIPLILILILNQYAISQEIRIPTEEIVLKYKKFDLSVIARISGPDGSLSYLAVKEGDRVVVAPDKFIKDLNHVELESITLSLLGNVPISEKGKIDNDMYIEFSYGDSVERKLESRVFFVRPRVRFAYAGEFTIRKTAIPSSEKFEWRINESYSGNNIVEKYRKDAFLDPWNSNGIITVPRYRAGKSKK